MASQRVKACFSPVDDEELIHLVTVDKETDWSSVSRLMHGRFTSRQCRERWKNYLDVNLKRDSWSPEEDQVLLAEYARVGNRWTALAAAVQGRSPGVVRNRLFLLLRKKSTPGGMPQSAPADALPALPIEPSDKDSAFMDLFGISEPPRFYDFSSDAISPFFFSGL
jgi:hypothetical protein